MTTITRPTTGDQDGISRRFALLGSPLVSFLSCLLLVAAPSARANTVYQYMGRPFDTFRGGLTNPPYTNLTGFFELASALPANLGNTDLYLPGFKYSVLNFSFSAGEITINFSSQRSDNTFIDVTTDGDGNINTWRIQIAPPTYYFPGMYSSNIPHSETPVDLASPDGPGLAEVSGRPGTWSVIPEPSTGLLVMTGLLGIAYRQRRQGRGPVTRDLKKES